MTRLASHTSLRAACVTLLGSYGSSASLNLQTYPARPATIFPPCAFVDRIDESIDYTAGLRQSHPVAQVVVIWGDFDSKEAADQRDAFCDGFLDTVTDDPDAIAASTAVELNRISDEPTFQPDWGNDIQRNTIYYATRFFLEGLVLEGD